MVKDFALFCVNARVRDFVSPAVVAVSCVSAIL